jgi:hypothetical protein
MNPILRNILAVIAGVIVGSIVNGGIISIGSSIIPLPEGVDVSTMEGLKAAMPLYEPRHFMMPFLAHALGTLAGAFITALLVANNRMPFAMGIGVLFLAGGVAMVSMVPSPTWFTITDLAGAYIPMAFIGAKLAGKKK